MNSSEFKQRYLPCHRRMFQTAFRLTHNRQDAEDLVQDAYTKLWERRGDIHITDNPEAYCCTLVRNLFIDQRRKDRMQTVDQTAAILPLSGTTDVSRELEDREDGTAVMSLIDRLPEQQRQIITLRDVEAHTYEEIEQTTGLTAVNIRVLLSRARKTIREQFRNQNKK